MGKDRTTLVTKTADVGSRESISERQARTTLAVKGVDADMKTAELDSREAIALLQAEISAIKARLDATAKTNGAAE
jgi:uncharacterized small protein (DUF1192 family)